MTAWGPLALVFALALPAVLLAAGILRPPAWTCESCRRDVPPGGRCPGCGRTFWGTPGI